MKSTRRRGRGEGSVERLKSGKWRAVLSAGSDPLTGRQRKLRETLPTKEQALDWLADRRQERRQGTLATGKMTLAAWLATWLDGKRATVEPQSWDNYERTVKKLLPLTGRLVLARLTTLDVEAVLARLAKDGHSAAEVGKCATTLTAALNDAVRLGLLAVNPAARCRRPRHRRPDFTCYDEAQARKFLLVSRRHRLAALWRLLLDAGCRPGEAQALHWPEVDLDGGSVFVRQSLVQRGQQFRLKGPKTAKGKRRVQLCEATVNALRWHKLLMRGEGRDTTTGPVFVSRVGGWLRRRDLAKAFRRLAKRAALPRIRMYDLRHTSATLLLSRDVNIKVVSERLGHESIEITLRYYAHCLPDMQERAVLAAQQLFGDYPTERPTAPPTRHPARAASGSGA
jgi:integrase